MGGRRSASTSCSGPGPPRSSGIVVRTGSGPSFPAAERRGRRPRSRSRSRRTSSGRCAGSSFVLVVLVALAAMYLGTGLALRRRSVASSSGSPPARPCTSLFGAPSGRPSAAQIEPALGDLGLDVDRAANRLTIRYPGRDDHGRHASATAPVRVVALGRDQRDGQLAAKLWHNVMYKDPGAAGVRQPAPDRRAPRVRVDARRAGRRRRAAAC